MSIAGVGTLRWSVVSQTKVESIAVAGAGKVGTAIGRLLREAGQPVVAVASRDAEHASRGAKFCGGPVRAARYAELPSLAQRILITVADDAIPELARALGEAGMEGGVALHTCGALGPDVLSPLEERGVSCGVLHPMQTIPSPELGLTALRGISWGITAEGAAAEWADEIVQLLGGRALPVAAGKRALYHAAGVTACNYLIGLLDAAAILMEATGVTREAALSALAPIVETTRRNVFEMGPVEALTGPILRGDHETVARHLEALETQPETIRELYRAAGLHTLGLARQRGLGEDAARQLERLLRDNGIRNA